MALWDKLKGYRPGQLLGGFALSCLLTAGQWGGLYAPWCIGFAAACGASRRGLAAVLGALVGGYLFFPFQEALRHGATVLVLYAAALSFTGSRLARRVWFAPLCAAGSMLLVHSVYLVGRSFAHTALCIISAAAAGLLSRQLQGVTLRSRMELLGVGLCLALSGIAVDGFSLGRLGAVWLALWLADHSAPERAAALGACIGLALDLTATRPEGALAAILAVACYGAAGLRSRSLRAVAYCALVSFFASLLRFEGVAELSFEALTAAAAYLLTPKTMRQPAASAALPDDIYGSRATAFRALYDALFGGWETPPEENPAVIFDRAAEKVCRACPQAAVCYHKEYQSTHDAFTHAAERFLSRGQAQRGDFPAWFLQRCGRFAQFLDAANDELYGYLLRHRYHRRLYDLRRLASLPYAQVGASFATVSAAAERESYRLSTAVALRPRQGHSLCGDETAVFTVGGETYLLLSDGMGSGKEAHAESSMTVRLLRQFLEAGILAEPSIQTLNTALRLRGGDGFTTIDLGVFRASDGRMELHKYGAAYSYHVSHGTVARLSANTLPAGLHDAAVPPPPLRITMRHGDMLLMVSDGVLENGDKWLCELLERWNGTPQELAAEVMERCRDSGDDCAVIAAGCRKSGVRHV